MEMTTPASPDEGARLLEIMHGAFGGPREEWDRYREIQGDENLRLVRLGGEVAGGLGVLFMGQFFGGRCVPMVGIGAVAVSPEHRGSGVATTLMLEIVKELHARGVALSTLYPATEPLYRRAGYEQAGIQFRLRLSLASIGIRDRELPAKRIEESDMEVVERIHRHRAVSSPGNLDRIPYNWFEIRTRGPKGFLFGEDAYLFYKETPMPGEARKVVGVTDHAAVTAAGVRRLLTFLADHSSLYRDALLFVGPSDPLLAVVPEQRYKPIYYDHWMVRVVDLPAAMEARGYSPGVQAELHFEVADDLIEQNVGPWTVRVQDGAAKAERGGRGELRLDVRALASLYTGHLSVATLENIGWLEGPPEALQAAQTVFAGPAPWMSDGF